MQYLASLKNQHFFYQSWPYISFFCTFVAIKKESDFKNNVQIVITEKHIKVYIKNNAYEKVRIVCNAMAICKF